MHNTVYCKLFEVEKFPAYRTELYNSLENIHGWTVVLHGQGLLHRLSHCNSFAVTNRYTKTVKLFHFE